MAKTDYKTIDQYHKVFPGYVRERMQAVREMVHKIAPDVVEVISYQIPALKIGKKFLIYYAGFENHLSISSPWTKAYLDEFARDLKGLKVSKSIIQFPHDRPLPTDFINRLLRFRKREVDGKQADAASSRRQGISPKNGLTIAIKGFSGLHG